MMEHSDIAEDRQSADGDGFRRSSKQELKVDRCSRGSSERHMASGQMTDDARIQENDVGDHNFIDNDCERLSKYPDYCRTITIRGLRLKSTI